MQIDQYKVLWVKWGFSYAKPVVYERRQSILRLLWPWKRAWLGPSRLYVHAEKMHPKEMRDWFEAAVREMEAYRAAWANR